MSNLFVILIAFTGYSLLNFSQAIQKIGLLYDKKHYIKKWLIWLSGTLGTLIAIGIVMIAIAFGKVSVVSSMAGCGLIVLAIFSYFVLKEKISLKNIFGIILIVIGSGLVGLLNNQSSEKEMNLLPIIIYPITFCLIYLILWLFGHKSTFSGFIAGGCSGMFAGLAVIFQKALLIHGNIFSLPNNNENYFILQNPYLYLWLGVTVISFLILQFAYHLGTNIQIIPSYNVNMIIVPAIGGVIVFNENLIVWQWLSILLIIVGVFLLTTGGKKIQKTESGNSGLT
jgi:drug/metabolite transporter (DMT)-like permease